MLRRLVVPLLGLVLLAGCSSGEDDAASPGTTTATATTTQPATQPATTAPSAPAAQGCPAAPSGQPSGVPEGATAKPTLDVDGDGRPDTLWIDDGTAAGGAVVFGVQTASGGTLSTDFNSASGSNARTVLVADVTGDGELVALADDGRSVRLYGLSDCSLVPEQNAQGEQYTFDLGFTGFGTGVGCADVDGNGTRDLVGLLADGTSVTSTVVALDGPRATNGASSTIADATPQQLDLASQVSCGDLTLAADGVTLTP